MLPGLKSLPQPLGQGLFSKRPCFAILELASGDKTRSERGRGLDVDCREAITGIVWGLLELTGVPKVNPRDASLPVSIASAISAHCLEDLGALRSKSEFLRVVSSVECWLFVLPQLWHSFFSAGEHCLGTL